MFLEMLLIVHEVKMKIDYLTDFKGEIAQKLAICWTLKRI